MGGILKMEFHVKTASWEDLIWTEQHHGGISLGQNSIMGDLIGTEQPHGGGCHWEQNTIMGGSYWEQNSIIVSVFL